MRQRCLAAVAALLSACGSVPSAEKLGVVQLRRMQPTFEVVISDGRAGRPLKPLLDPETTLLTDASFVPLPMEYLRAALAAHISSSEWSSRATPWILERTCSLLYFDARIVKPAAHPSSNNHAAMAAVSPIGPAAGMLFDSIAAELQRQKYAELSVGLECGGVLFEDGSLARLTGVDTKEALATLAETVAKALAGRIAEESVGLSARK